MPVSWSGRRLDGESKGGWRRQDTKALKVLYHDSKEFSNPSLHPLEKHVTQLTPHSPSFITVTSTKEKPGTKKVSITFKGLLLKTLNKTGQHAGIRNHCAGLMNALLQHLLQ